MFFCCFSLTIAYNISFFSLPITFLLWLKQKENSSCLNSDCEAENEEKVFLSLLWQAETYQFELMDKRVSSFDIFFFGFTTRNKSTCEVLKPARGFAGCLPYRFIDKAESRVCLPRFDFFFVARFFSPAEPKVTKL